MLTEHEITELQISAPGRICLFGEHQDYLNLPVITSAISLRIFVYGKRIDNRQIFIRLPQLGSCESFILQHEIPYVKERDYFRSAVNIMQRHGYTFSSGFECEVMGEIPINAGTSSSSALMVAWVQFLARMSDQQMWLEPELTARYAHQAEVLEFNEPGGMMDHFSTALGKLIYLDFSPEVHYQKLPLKLKSFVLGDSMQEKNTKYILTRVKNEVINVSQNLKHIYPDFSLRNVSDEDLEKFEPALTAEQNTILSGTIKNYRITQEAKKVLTSANVDHKKIGRLLNKHHNVLRNVLKISTPKIDSMIEAALEAGAYGAKINGSGGGGCMFAYAPKNTEKIAEAIESRGGKAYIIHVADGIDADLIK